MFRKVLKYDFRAVGRLWWILALSVTWISILGAFVLRFMISYFANDMAEFNLIVEMMVIGGIIFLVGSFIAIGASGLLSQLLVYYRFYKNFFTDEGYLTFTLPVSRKTLLLAKTVNAFIWSVFSGALIFLCIGIFILIAPPSEYASQFYRMFFSGFLADAFSFILDGVGAWIIIYAIEAILIFCAYSVFTISLIHLCITIGAIVAKKYKLLAGVGIYYVANMVISTVSQIVMIFGSSIFGAIYDEFIAEASTAAKHGFTTFTMLLVLIAISALAFVTYTVTRKKLECKLNLE